MASKKAADFEPLAWVLSLASTHSVISHQLFGQHLLKLPDGVFGVSGPVKNKAICKCHLNEKVVDVSVNAISCVCTLYKLHVQYIVYALAAIITILHHVAFN